ncbi:hypothetical protein M0Q97_01940 [Candidatus Dojkabacteria bacterium]|jgi:hypothetical protein|nr:hypothetical protein [Candidatus Dojkabacteria bacterium]
MKTKCHSVRLASLVSISDKAYKAVAFDGSEAIMLMLDKSYECDKTEISIIENIKYEFIKKQDLIDSIYIGYNEKLLNMKNDEEGIDEEPENTNLPINCNESQYAYEFGFMDEYLQGILIDSNSEFTIDNLK